MISYKYFRLIPVMAVAACATPAPPPVVDTTSVAQSAAVQALPPLHVLKRKVAVGRFSNETLYGKALLVDGQEDPLGRQTSDMLSTALTNSGKFLVFERPDLGLITKEQSLEGLKTQVVGVDDLLIGSLTQFGRETEGEAGFLSNTKKQVARAKVEIRLVDVATARVIFTTTGTGEAAVENGTVMGFGNQSNYDETLNDRAIGAAIDDAMTPLVAKLSEKPWSTDILQVQGGQVYISGGAHQGLTPGTRLAVMSKGATVHSTQTGMDITLPGQKLADITVQSNFGGDESSEGSICTISDGTLPVTGVDQLVVTEEAN